MTINSLIAWTHDDIEDAAEYVGVEPERLEAAIKYMGEKKAYLARMEAKPAQLPKEPVSGSDNDLPSFEDVRGIIPLESPSTLNAVTDDNHEFDEWWSKEGIFLDPDTSDVPWFDKRKGLCTYAFYYGKKLGQSQALKAASRSEIPTNKESKRLLDEEAFEKATVAYYESIRSTSINDTEVLGLCKSFLCNYHAAIAAKTIWGSRPKREISGVWLHLLMATKEILRNDGATGSECYHAIKLFDARKSAQNAIKEIEDEG